VNGGGWPVIGGEEWELLEWLRVFKEALPFRGVLRRLTPPRNDGGTGCEVRVTRWSVLGGQWWVVGGRWWVVGGG